MVNKMGGGREEIGRRVFPEVNFYKGVCHQTVDNWEHHPAPNLHYSIPPTRPRHMQLQLERMRGQSFLSWILNAARQPCEGS